MENPQIVPLLPEKQPKKKGRPTKYNQKLANTICKRIALGESLRNICREIDMPTISTVMLWNLYTDKYKGFSEQYAQARVSQAQNMFDEILTISDQSDDIVRKGAEKKASAYSQNQKLKVETRKWYLSKVLPKVYGDKLDLTSGGEKLPQPILQLNQLNAPIKGKIIEHQKPLLEPPNDLPPV